MSSFERHFPIIALLLAGYSNVRRAVVQPYHYQEYTKHHINYTYSPADAIVRESLLEHVGNLPVLACYFHPFLDTPIDLGKTLQILAIHDIGELTVGDINTFNKTVDVDENEQKAALALLHPSQHDLYQEYIQMQTNEAKFAKSIDKLAPDLYDVLTDYKVNSIRLATFTNNTPSEIPALIEKFKAPYMEWNPFLREFHSGLVAKLKSIYKN